jgi:hypothetical protein
MQTDAGPAFGVTICTTGPAADAVIGLAVKDDSRATTPAIAAATILKCMVRIKHFLLALST